MHWKDISSHWKGDAVKVTRYILLMVIGSLIPTVAIADQLPTTGQQDSRFSIHDTNHDGLIDRYEFGQLIEHRNRHARQKDWRPRYGRIEREFSDIDENADGYITEDEMVQMLNRQLRQQRRYRIRERRWSSDNGGW